MNGQARATKTHFLFSGWRISVEASRRVLITIIAPVVALQIVREFIRQGYVVLLDGEENLVKKKK